MWHDKNGIAYPHIKVRLDDIGMNPFAIIKRVRDALRKNGISERDIDAATIYMSDYRSIFVGSTYFASGALVSALEGHATPYSLEGSYLSFMNRVMNIVSVDWDDPPGTEEKHAAEIAAFVAAQEADRLDKSMEPSSYGEGFDPSKLGGL